MRYFFHIAYHGQNFNGWQKHPKARSVQEIIEQKLAQIFKTTVPIIGCGRTDSQVHASQFFFHAELPDNFDFDLPFRLNKILPSSISVFDVLPVSEKKHARFDAVQRKYDYFIHTYKDPFLSSLSSYYALQLDAEKIAEAVAILPKYSDYRAFCTSPDKYEHTICNVSDSKFFTNEAGDRFRFQITSNRFLSKMIRIIVGQLLKIGTGEMDIELFEFYLSEKKTPPLLEPAHPTGLYLSKVTYPYLDLPPRAQILASSIEWQSL